jgi:hypothetical protein
LRVLQHPEFDGPSVEVGASLDGIVTPRQVSAVSPGAALYLSLGAFLPIKRPAVFALVGITE